MKEEMIKSLGLSLFALLQKQGLPFLMLAAALYYFHTENKHLEAKIDQCNSSLIQIYQSQQKEFIEVLEKISIHLEK